MSKKIAIMLVEDNETYRNVIARALSRELEMELISQFGTAEIALRSLQDLSTRQVPHIILLDLNLPGMNGLEALSYFQQELPDTKIIILTQSDKEADVLNAMCQGASGYLLKSATNQQIKEGIHTVMKGGATLDPHVALFIISTLKKAPKKNEQKITLTEKELKILAMIGDGIEQKDIANKLFITRNTVAFHVKNIYEKLNVKNAPAAIHKAHNIGLLPIHKK